MRPILKTFRRPNNLSIVLSICALLSLSSSIAQPSTTVYTPKGTPVSVWILTEMTPSQISATNSQASLLFPNASIVSNSSTKYNCHAYAWYLTECTGCTKYWMDSPEEDKYWQDCSYVEVSASQAQKISYANDDHSAVKSIVAGKYDSKWGQWPVMRHSPTYTPYISTNLKYYVKPSVSGPSTFCSTGTFNVTAPSGTTITWSVTPSSAATFPTGSGTSKTFTRSGSYSGNATIKATMNFSNGCSSSLLTKSVSIGPIITITSPNWADSQGMLPVTVGNGTGNYKYYKNGTLLLASGSGSVNLNWGCSGGLLKVTCNTNCGTGELTRTIYQNCNSNLMVVYPNPSSIELFIGYDERAQTGTIPLNRSVTYENPIQTEMYDFSGNLLIAEEFKKSSSIPSLNISDLKKGTYFLRIVGKEIDEVHQVVKQ